MSKKKISKVVWFTGLSGSGKTTLAKIFYKKFLKYKYKCLIVDGDIFRKKRKKNLFTRNSITKNNYDIINYCKKFKFNYDYLFVSVISPLKKTREVAFSEFKENYFEIRVFCSLRNLIKRDTKGLYELARKGKIKNLIGFNSAIKYEKSTHQHLRINTGILDKKKCYRKILKFINED